ncbi:putative quinol monooxygenase [Curvivirga sp.]|uniref:putative quinol monooxygenase n=1 Tax=Curvivirga sp. TaxID=2856848 RepID=UPI003B59C00F
MIAILVDFKIKPKFIDKFIIEMKAQAENTLRLEKDCHQFDIAINPNDMTEIFLYELYSDEDAFNMHLKTKHFLSFDQIVKNWIENKNVRILEKVYC